MADQPFSFHHPRSTFAYNGEAFNLDFLTKALPSDTELRTDSDTEVVGRLLLRRDWAVMAKLDGPWAFALWNEESESLLLGRDPQGRRPLYAHHSESDLIFGSDASAIAALVGTNRGLTDEALANYLLLGFVGPRDSGYRNVTSVFPGSILEWSPTDPNLRPVDHIQPPLPSITSETRRDGRAASHLRLALVNAVQERAGRGEGTAISLSGGIDSSAILLAALSAGVEPIAYAMDWTNADKAKYSDDGRLAAANARHTGVPLVRVEGPSPREVPGLLDRFVSLIGAPNASPTSLSQLAMQDEIRKGGLRITLTGDGADELLLGYPRYATATAITAPPLPAWLIDMMLCKAYPSHKVASFLEATARRLAWGGSEWAPSSWHWVFSPREIAYMTKLDAIVPTWVAPHASLGVGRGCETRKASSLERQASWDVVTWLRGEVNPVADAVSMATGGEIRTPFQSRIVFDSLRRFPVSAGSRDGRKRELWAAFPELARLELAQAKQGYLSPVGHWLRGNEQFVRESIDALTCEVTALWNLASWTTHEFFAGSPLSSPRKLWSLLVLARWMQPATTRPNLFNSA